jgi:hypothetical protein
MSILTPSAGHSQSSRRAICMFKTLATSSTITSLSRKLLRVAAFSALSKSLASSELIRLRIPDAFKVSRQMESPASRMSLRSFSSAASASGELVKRPFK